LALRFDVADSLDLIQSRPQCPEERRYLGESRFVSVCKADLRFERLDRGAKVRRLRIEAVHLGVHVGNRDPAAPEHRHHSLAFQFLRPKLRTNMDNFGLDLRCVSQALAQLRAGLRKRLARVQDERAAVLPDEVIEPVARDVPCLAAFGWVELDVV
jgi:hypothetical protein